MPVKIKKICYRKEQISTVKHLISLSLNKYSETVFVGDLFSLPMVGNALYSDGTSSAVSLIWNDVASTSQTGISYHTASYTENGITKINSFMLNVISVSEEIKLPIGMNLGGIQPYMGVRAFVDIMKEARATWGRADQSIWSCEDVIMDELCNPTCDAQKVVWESSMSAKGDYNLIFNGQATVSGTTGMTYDPITNTSTAIYNVAGDVATGGLTFTNTKKTSTSALNTGVTNVRLYRPDYPTDGSKIFTDEFINVLGQFGILRFMDWNQTNSNNSVNWEDRTLPECSTQMKKLNNSISANGHVGVAYEYMIALCNQVNADMYINIPPCATDDYVTQLCNLIKNGRTDVYGKFYAPLKESLKVYVEYGNEVWNFGGGFYNFGWVLNQSNALKTDLAHPIMHKPSSNDYGLAYRFVGYKMVQISNIFRSVFGDAQMMSRIRPLVEGQLANMYWMQEAIELIDEYYGNLHPVNYYIYGGGGGLYYTSNVDTTKGTDYIIAHHFDEGLYPTADYTTQNTNESIFLKKFGLKKIAYEGGAEVMYAGLTDPQQRAINRDPKMYEFVRKHHEVYKKCGGDIFIYYVIGNYSIWEYTHDRMTGTDGKIYPKDTPKMLALKDLASSHLNSEDFYYNEYILTKYNPNYVRFPSSYGTGLINGKLCVNGERDLTIKIYIPKDGTYKIGLCGTIYGNPATPATVEKGRCTCSIGGVPIGEILVPPTGEGVINNPIYTYITATVKKGTTTFRLKNKYATQMSLYAVDIMSL